MNKQEYWKNINDPSQKVCFELGVLSKKIVNIESVKSSTPFTDKLKLDELNLEKLQKLYSKVINKLNKFGVMENNNKLCESISGNFTKSLSDWSLDNDDIRYYFTLGFTLEQKY